MSAQELLNTLHGDPVTALSRRTRKWRQRLSRRFAIWSHGVGVRYRAEKRHLVSLLRQWRGRQYFVWTAVREMRRGLLLNADISLGVSYIGLTIAFAAANVYSTLIVGFLPAIMTFSDAFGLPVEPFLALGVVMVVLCLAWVLAFICNGVSLSLLQGLRRTIYRSTVYTLRQALAQTSRVVAVWVAYLALLGAPLALMAVGGLVLVLTEVITFDQFVVALPYLIIAGFTWVLFVIMNYTLAPIVALFETQLGLVEAFRRARRLVIGRGRIFIVASFGLLLAAFAALYGVAAALKHAVGLPSLPVMFFGSVVLAMGWSGLLTALYRRRTCLTPYRFDTRR